MVHSNAALGFLVTSTILSHNSILGTWTPYTQKAGAAATMVFQKSGHCYLALRTPKMSRVMRGSYTLKKTALDIRWDPELQTKLGISRINHCVLTWNSPSEFHWKEELAPGAGGSGKYVVQHFRRVSSSERAPIPQ
ncbi:MAG TPA: hypothetical protein VG944_14300 [Fimbriimonas sp.]|nr:hypothetical protein [Fimbriimonas sp.]